MKHRHLIGAVLLAAVLLPAAAHAQTTMEECMKAARANWPQIVQKQLIEESARYDIAKAGMAWIPQLKISGKASYQSDVTKMPFEIPGYDFDMPLDQYSLTGEITQTIWDGGNSKSTRERVRADAQVSSSQLETSLYAINSRVQNLYLGILLLDEQISQNRILEESLERNIAEAEARIANGVAMKSDLEIIRVSQLDCIQQRTELETTRQAYISMLSRFTGMDLEGVRLEVPQYSPASDCDSITRPELQLYDAQLRQNEAMERQLDSKISPTFSLSLQGGYGRPGLDMLKNEFSPYYVAAIRMNWDLGALYTRKDDKRKYEVSRRNIESEREAFLLNTRMDIIEQQGEVRKAEQALLRDEEIIALRESIRKSGEEQYRGGTITMTELMDRIDDEHDARTARAIHRIQLLMAYYQLKNTIGYEAL